MATIFFVRVYETRKKRIFFCGSETRDFERREERWCRANDVNEKKKKKKKNIYIYRERERERKKER